MGGDELCVVLLCVVCCVVFVSVLELRCVCV